MILLKERGKVYDKFIFSSLPESVTITNDTNYQSYSLINKQVKIAKGVEVKKITWDGEFFGRVKSNELLVRAKYWKKPTQCRKILEKWQGEGTILTLILTEARLNIDVTIASFTPVSYGAQGNVKYNIVLEKAEFLQVKQVKGFKFVKQSGGNTTDKTDKKDTKNPKDKILGGPKTKPRPTVKQSKSYSVVSGDNLWKIARKFYGGSGSNWKKIYNANQDIIEKTAKQRGKKSSDQGHWIFPGTTLTIPES